MRPLRGIYVCLAILHSPTPYPNNAPFGVGWRQRISPDQKLCWRYSCTRIERVLLDCFLTTPGITHMSPLIHRPLTSAPTCVCGVVGLAPSSTRASANSVAGWFFQRKSGCAHPHPFETSRRKEGADAPRSVKSPFAARRRNLLEISS